MSDFLASLSVRVGKEPRRILFPEALDPRVLQAARNLRGALVEPIMVHGPLEDVSETVRAGLEKIVVEEEKAEKLGALLLEIRKHKSGTKDELTLEKAHQLARDPLIYGMYFLREGEADGLVAGAAYTSGDVIRAGLWIVGKEKGIATVSSSFYMIVPPFRGGEKEEVLTFTDCAVVPNPTAEQLADIAIAAADARRRVVGDQPYVAFLSFSTKGSGGDESPSIKNIRTALDIVRTKRPDLKIEGELQADAALIESVSERKLKSGSEIGHGKANVLVFPDLDSGNIAYKLIERLVPGAKAYGPILQGFAKPISDLSRGVDSASIEGTARIVASQVTSPQE